MSQLPAIPEIKMRLAVLNPEERRALIKRMEGELSSCAPMPERETRSLLLQRTQAALAEVEITERRMCEYPAQMRHHLPDAAQPPAPIVSKEAAKVIVFGTVTTAGVACAYLLIGQIIESGVLVWILLFAALVLCVQIWADAFRSAPAAEPKQQRETEREILMEQIQRIYK